VRRSLALVGVALLSTVTWVAANAAPRAAGAVPAGFTDTQIPNPPGNPLSGPTTITAMPDGRALVLEKGGAVRVLQADGTLLGPDAIALSVCTPSEAGLLGAAIDPAFITNGFVYLYYTRNAGNCGSPAGRFNRVSRFTMTGNSIDPGSELVLLDNIAATGGNHNGGALAIGQDGFLHVGVGDAGTNPRGAGDTAAEDLSLLSGKILRITTTGAVPADNPFVGAAGAASCATAGIAAPVTTVCTEIFALGLRNPYRFAFDPNSGATRFFINDVGQNTWEEVDQGGKGLNYGWNNREGACVMGSESNCPPPPAGVTDPLTAYNHSSGCSYITAGVFVPNGVWPSSFDGSYLFADGGCGRMWQRTAAGAVDYANPFTTTSGGIVDMAFVAQGADPALFYVTNGGSQLRKISYDAPPAPVSSTLAYASLPLAQRAYDTRNNTGVDAGPVRGGTTRLVDLGINDPNVKAALVNLTMVQPVGQGFLTVSAGRVERPATSNINAGPGEFVANASIVPVDGDGNIVVFSSVTTHLVVDVMGLFSQVSPTTAGGRFTALAPRRLIDTREISEPAANNFTSIANGGIADVTAPVTGRLGVPASVSAVALIVTGVSTPGSGAGFVAVHPGGTPVPQTSNLNVNGNGDVRPNLVIVPVGADGTIAMRLSNTEFVVVDIAGYFTNASTPAGLYHVIAPSRQADSRIPLGFGPLPIGTSQMLDPSGGVPAGAVAISQNVTMTQTLGGGFVTAYPADAPRPLASNANASGPNQDRASLALTKVGAGANGAVGYYSSGGTQLVVDITGYFD
jgi:glucose/arabinose dehydrogenase